MTAAKDDSAAKQKSSAKAASAESEKTTQPAKNNLPAGLTPEKLKLMLGSLGDASRMETEPTGAEEDSVRVPDPLWNPQSL